MTQDAAKRAEEVWRAIINAQDDGQSARSLRLFHAAVAEAVTQKVQAIRDNPEAFVLDHAPMRVYIHKQIDEAVKEARTKEFHAHDSLREVNKALVAQLAEAVKERDYFVEQIKMERSLRVREIELAQAEARREERERCAVVVEGMCFTGPGDEQNLVDALLRSAARLIRRSPARAPVPLAETLSKCPWACTRGQINPKCPTHASAPEGHKWPCGEVMDPSKCRCRGTGGEK